MKLHHFAIPALAPKAAEDLLNQHLATYRVAHIDKQFVANGAARRLSTWVVAAAQAFATRTTRAGLVSSCLSTARLARRR